MKTVLKTPPRVKMAAAGRPPSAVSATDSSERERGPLPLCSWELARRQPAVVGPGRASVRPYPCSSNM